MNASEAQIGSTPVQQRRAGELTRFASAAGFALALAAGVCCLPAVMTVNASKPMGPTADAAAVHAVHASAWSITHQPAGTVFGDAPVQAPVQAQGQAQTQAALLARR